MDSSLSTYRWIQDILYCIKLEKIRFSLNNSLEKFHKTWQPFLNHIDTLTILEERTWADPPPHPPSILSPIPWYEWVTLFVCPVLSCPVLSCPVLSFAVIYSVLTILFYFSSDPSFFTIVIFLFVCLLWKIILKINKQICQKNKIYTSLSHRCHRWFCTLVWF